METYLVLKDLAIIIIAAKVCGIIARKLHAPQVVGTDYRRTFNRSLYTGICQPDGFSYADG